MELLEYSTREFMAIVIARDIKDGEYGTAGVGGLIPLAAMLLAKNLHAPNLVIGGDIFTNPDTTHLSDSLLTEEALRRCEAVEGFDELCGYSNKGLDFFFYSGIQIDQYGNINLHHVGGTVMSPVFRGPGVANVSYGATCKRTYLYTMNHSPRTFVKKVDFISVPGHLNGPESKLEKGLKNGPRFCVTPLAVMDFNPETLRMQIKSVHPGHEVEEVKRLTGFELDVSPSFHITPGPKEEELEVLRSIDRDGLLK